MGPSFGLGTGAATLTFMRGGATKDGAPGGGVAVKVTAAPVAPNQVKVEKIMSPGIRLALSALLLSCWKV